MEKFFLIKFLWLFTITRENEQREPIFIKNAGRWKLRKINHYVRPRLSFSVLVSRVLSRKEWFFIEQWNKRKTSGKTSCRRLVEAVKKKFFRKANERLKQTQFRSFLFDRRNFCRGKFLKFLTSSFATSEAKKLIFFRNVFSALQIGNNKQHSLDGTFSRVSWKLNSPELFGCHKTIENRKQVKVFHQNKNFLSFLWLSSRC